MAAPHDAEDRRPVVVQRPLPGVTVARFVRGRSLLRAVSEHYGTTMHLAGHSQWTSGRAQWTSEPGSVSVKSPGELAIERSREGELAFQTVLFAPSLVDEARAALGRRVVGPPVHAIDPGHPSSHRLVALHRRLRDAEVSTVLEEAVTEAIHALVDAMHAPVGTGLARRSGPSVAVARARAMLDERLTEPVGLDALAAHARMDKFRLCRAFREEIGLPPHAYVTHRRVARAQELLGRGVSQAEAAARVGFYDQSLLHRHFKRIVGITPGAFVRASA